MPSKTIAIDLDGVIHDYKQVEWPKLGTPMTDAQPSIKRLQRLGYRIVVFTSRATNKEILAEIMDWLDSFKIPYYAVTNIKGDFDYIIDDRAVHFNTWGEVFDQIKPR